MRAHFEEKQKFTQGWLWLIVASATILVLGVFANGMYQQLFLGTPWGDRPLSDDQLIIVSVLTITAIVLTLLLIFNASLEIIVDRTSISYRYFPIVRKWKRLEREEILSFTARKFPVANYGVRRDLSGNRTLTISGYNAVELTTHNGKTVTIGTQKLHEFLLALEQMKSSRAK